jgi:hypothetical protein
VKENGMKISPSFKATELEQETAAEERATAQESQDAASQDDLERGRM